LDFIEKYAYDSMDLRIKLATKIRSFKSTDGSFGRTTVVALLEICLFPANFPAEINPQVFSRFFLQILPL
jgi:hypothetical protein